MEHRSREVLWFCWFSTMGFPYTNSFSAPNRLGILWEYSVAATIRPTQLHHLEFLKIKKTRETNREMFFQQCSIIGLRRLTNINNFSLYHKAGTPTAKLICCDIRTPSTAEAPLPSAETLPSQKFPDVCLALSGWCYAFVSKRKDSAYQKHSNIWLSISEFKDVSFLLQSWWVINLLCSFFSNSSGHCFKFSNFLVGYQPCSNLSRGLSTLR
jgi:hypothetical protein